MKGLGNAESPPGMRWGAVESLAAKTARDIAAPQPNLPFILVGWCRQVELFRDAENERIITDTPSAEERHAHKQALTMLISQGESLLGCLRQHDITAQVGLTLADIEATVEELYDRQRVFYGGMTEARRTQVLNEVFGAS